MWLEREVDVVCIVPEAGGEAAILSGGVPGGKSEGERV